MMEVISFEVHSYCDGA
ncbi:hypothetical protein NPIL_117821, partial [Nephila pilipes]